MDITPQFHVLSNGRLSNEVLVEKFVRIADGVDYLHVREKNKSESELEYLINLLLAENIPKHKLIVNGHYHLAGKYHLRAVHIPESIPSIKNIKLRFPDLMVGCSVHSVSSAKNRELEGADYLFFGNIYETSCKPGKLGKGYRELNKIARSSNLPVIGIGGIKPNNILEVLQAGASGIAVMSTIMEAVDPVDTIQQFKSAMGR